MRNRVHIDFLFVCLSHVSLYFNNHPYVVSKLVVKNLSDNKMLWILSPKSFFKKDRPNVVLALVIYTEYG